jgi:hypothetical protein
MVFSFLQQQLICAPPRFRNPIIESESPSVKQFPQIQTLMDIYGITGNIQKTLLVLVFGL